VKNDYLVITIVVAAMEALAGVQKLRRDPKVVHVMQDVVGVPLNIFRCWRLVCSRGPRD
jgi:hypothetical protein